MEVRLSAAEEDAPPCSSATQRGEKRLEAAGTWREPTEVEPVAKKKVVPVAILLMKKRDGALKAKACVLGELVSTDGLIVYALVSTMAGQR